MDDKKHLFVAIEADEDDDKVLIFCGLSVDWLRENGAFEDLEITTIQAIPDDFFMKLAINSSFETDPHDERCFYAAPGGAGQGRAGWLATTIEWVGFIATADKDTFLPILYKTKGN